uniref:Light-harvesting protein B-800/850 gamma chain n=2 Tax=Rhodobacter capsulatus TaxID=1061 RepID=LHG2_RHOCA|nr:RecName: Full=Light-harvesting protein B-800/850 gamma chain [Rhodobacter capsulatus]AAA26165.1 pucE protein [Rhodobacter capsulatus]
MTDNIMKDHRHIFLPQPVKADEKPGAFSERFGWKLLLDTPRKKNVYEGTKFMSQDFWPTPLVKTTAPKVKLIPADAPPQSAKFWKAPLLKDTPRQSNVIPGDFLPFSNTFGLATIQRR